MKTQETTDYRVRIREELAARCARNASYSLRSFARDLGLSPARLSDVLNGRYGLSRAAAAKIAKSLGLSNSESEHFCDQVESLHARSRVDRLAALKRLEQRPQAYRAVTLDGFQVISEWHHYAILELTLVKSFQSSTDWMAKRLGVSAHVVVSAVERLKRLDLLEEDASGRLKATDGFTASPDGIPSEAIKKFHRQILEKALLAVDFQSVDERDFSSMIMAVDSARLPAAKEKLRNFRRSFDKEFGASSGAKTDQVYCLALQFFSLQEKETGETK